MLRKANLLQDGSLWPRITFAEVGPRCAYCRSPHLARPVTLDYQGGALPSPLIGQSPMSLSQAGESQEDLADDEVEVTTLCFSCRMEAVEFGYQVTMSGLELN